MSNDIIFRYPFMNNMFKEIEALMDFDFNNESKGLRKIISRPHNLITRKDKDGKISSFELQVVHTPFKKSEVKVNVLDNVLSVQCGTENKIKDKDMDYCGISHQSYQFSLPLSEQIDTKTITAHAEDGVLYVNLPVKGIEEDKPEAQVIEVM